MIRISMEHLLQALRHRPLFEVTIYIFELPWWQPKRIDPVGSWD
jgi:hypothetical protein